MQHSACKEQGITQRPWQQGIGETDEYSQQRLSRNSDGNVPNVYWNEGNRKVNVNSYTVGNSNPTNGLRQKF